MKMISTPVSRQKIYIAARFSKRHEAHALGQVLQKHGHTIVSRWSLPDSDHVTPVGLSEQAADSERERFCLEDIEDVEKCDWCISMMEEPRSNSRGGRHVEFGIALALQKHLTIIGPRETVFHHHPSVEYFHCLKCFFVDLTMRQEGTDPEAFYYCGQCDHKILDDEGTSTYDDVMVCDEECAEAYQAARAD